MEDGQQGNDGHNKGESIVSEGVREIFVPYQAILDATGGLDPMATARYIQERCEKAGFDPHFPIRVEKHGSHRGYRV